MSMRISGGSWQQASLREQSGGSRKTGPQASASQPNRIRQERLGNTTCDSQSSSRLLEARDLRTLRQGDQLRINTPVERPAFADEKSARRYETYDATVVSVTQRAEDKAYLLEVLPQDSKSCKLVVLHPGEHGPDATYATRTKRPVRNYFPGAKRLPDAPPKGGLASMYFDAPGPANPFGKIIKDYLGNDSPHKIEISGYNDGLLSRDLHTCTVPVEIDTLDRDRVGPAIVFIEGCHKRFRVKTVVQTTVLAVTHDYEGRDKDRGNVVFRVPPDFKDHFQRDQVDSSRYYNFRASRDGHGYLFQVDSGYGKPGLYPLRNSNSSACIPPERLDDVVPQTRITLAYRYTRQTSAANVLRNARTDLPAKTSYAHLPAVVLKSHDGWLDVCAPWDPRTLSSKNSPLLTESEIWHVNHDLYIDLRSEVVNVVGPQVKAGTDVAAYEGPSYAGNAPEAGGTPWFRFMVAPSADPELGSGIRLDTYFGYQALGTGQPSGPESTLQPRKTQDPGAQWRQLPTTALKWVFPNVSPGPNSRQLNETQLHSLEEGETVIVSLRPTSDTKLTEAYIPPIQRARATLLDKRVANGETTLLFGLDSRRISGELITLKIKKGAPLPRMERDLGMDTRVSPSHTAHKSMGEVAQAVRLVRLRERVPHGTPQPPDIAAVFCQEGYANGALWIRPLPGHEASLQAWDGMRSRRGRTEFLVAKNEFDMRVSSDRHLVLALKAPKQALECAVVFRENGAVPGTMWVRPFGDQDQLFAHCPQRNKGTGRERLIAEADYEISVFGRHERDSTPVDALLQNGMTRNDSTRNDLTRDDCAALPAGSPVRVGDLFEASFQSVPENRQQPTHIRVESKSGYGDVKGVQGLEEEPYFDGSGNSSYLVDLTKNKVFLRS